MNAGVGMALLLALTAGGGCATVGGHIARGAYGEACELSQSPRGARGAEERARRQQEVRAALRAATLSRVTVHAYSPEELSLMLPHVPARLASGEAVLVASRISFEQHDPAAVSWSFSLPGMPVRSCCGAESWAWLNDRPYQPPTTRRRRPRRRGLGGLLDMMVRGVAEMTGDLLWIGTLGIVNMPTVDDPMLPLGIIREALRGSGGSAGTPPPPSVDQEQLSDWSQLDEREREGVAAALLRQLGELDCGALAEPGSACTQVRIHRAAERPPEQLEIALGYWLEVPEGGFCTLSDDLVLPLAGETLSAGLAAHFPAGGVPIAELPLAPQELP